jgi:hypothetical protein
VPAYAEYRLKELAHRKVTRKKMTTIVLPPRKAKGSARNFQKPMRADRKPMMTSGTLDPIRSSSLTSGRR